MPKVSVIVPVYNVEKYLNKCIDSILAQTLQDIEVVCVDDGSTDASGVILDVYAARDNRVRVIHKQNAGYGAAINLGVDCAAGEYIGIVESDDYILPEMYHVLYQNAKAYQLDFVKSECVMFWEKFNAYRRVHVPYLEDYFNKVLTKDDRILFYQFFMNTWTGIYKKSFLEKNGIRHNETPGASYQDNGFWMQTLSMCERCMWLNEAFYMYRQDNPMASIKSKDKIMCMHDEYDHVQKILEERGFRKEVTICKYYRVLRNLGTFIRIYDEFKADYGRLMMKEFLECCEDIKDLEIHEKQNLFTWYQLFLEHTDAQINYFINKKNAVFQRLKDSRKLVVYGAGKIADAVCTRLYNMGMLDKVQDVCVTEKAQGQLFGHKVVVLDEVHNLEDACILIAVREGSKAYLDMESCLRNRGITQYMGSGDILQFFYGL